MATTKKSSTSKTKKSGARQTAAKKAVKSTKKTPKTTKTTSSSSVSTTKKKDLFAQLNIWNLVLSAIYFVAGVVVLMNTKDVFRSINTNFTTNDSITGVDGTAPVLQASRSLGDLNITYLAAAVLLVSAVAYLLRATVLRSQYEDRLKQEHGFLNWVEYGIGTGLALSLTGLIVGVSSAGLLVALFVGPLIAVRALKLMESMNHNKQSAVATNWGGLHIAKAAVLLPWVLIALALYSQYQYAATPPTGVVYRIAGIAFVLSMARMFVVRMYYKKRGDHNYLSIEWTQMMVNLAFNAALIGQIYVEFLSK